LHRGTAATLQGTPRVVWYEAKKREREREKVDGKQQKYFIVFLSSAFLQTPVLLLLSITNLVAAFVAACKRMYRTCNVWERRGGQENRSSVQQNRGEGMDG